MVEATYWDDVPWPTEFIDLRGRPWYITFAMSLSTICLSSQRTTPYSNICIPYTYIIYSIAPRIPPGRSVCLEQWWWLFLYQLYGPPASLYQLDDHPSSHRSLGKSCFCTSCMSHPWAPHFFFGFVLLYQLYGPPSLPCIFWIRTLWRGPKEALERPEEGSQKCCVVCKLRQKRWKYMWNETSGNLWSSYGSRNILKKRWKYV